MRALPPHRAPGWAGAPILMMVAAIALARLTIWLDQAGALRGGVSDEVLFAENAGAATTLLSVLTGALVGTLTTLFSVTLATLTFASSQFGPRLLALFLRDRRTYEAIGTLLATFAYCLTILRAIGNVNEPPFVPRFTLTVAMLLLATTLGALAYFSLFVSRLIQAPGLIAEVAGGLNRCCSRLRAERRDSGRNEYPCSVVGQTLPTTFDAEAAAVGFTGRGYIQRIDEARLLRLATARDVVLRLQCRPGQYAIPGGPLALVWPPQQLDQHLVDTFTLGWRRTYEQDIASNINQLVEIAVRALSPGINDPFTATQCIDRLADALLLLADVKFPSANRYDKGGACAL